MPLCADAHLEPGQKSTRMIIWSFPFRAELSGLFSATVSEADLRRCSVKKFANFCKIHRKIHVAESLFDAIFSSH